MEDNLNTKTTIHFRKDSAGNLLEVTELNTKITYIEFRQHYIGRFVISYNRVMLRSTFKARYRFFMYNNRVARFKRAVFPAVQRFFARFGVTLYSAQ